MVKKRAKHILEGVYLFDKETLPRFVVFDSSSVVLVDVIGDQSDIRQACEIVGIDYEDVEPIVLADTSVHTIMVNIDIYKEHKKNR